ncbi:hypothetical protein [Rhodoplanes azumiensis]|uniref:Uncharacterized protein n=1 Tax=Rhodoplanes azumiensis TaxID=1897628 RepID=A0ABW5AKK7_9BRAD
MNLTPAGISDSVGALMIPAVIRARWPGIAHLCTDSDGDRARLMDKAEQLDVVIEMIRRIDGQRRPPRRLASHDRPIPRRLDGGEMSR